ncbi:hypothetical protein [Thalassotalea ganghwensis]
MMYRQRFVRTPRNELINKHYLCYLVFVAIFLVYSSVSYAKSIKVGADYWQGYTNEDGTGVYFDILRQALSGYDIDISIDSYNRLKHRFNQGELDIVVGVFREDLPRAIYPQWHLDTEYPIVAMYKKDRFRITNHTQLTNLTVGWLRGYQFEKFLPNVSAPYLTNSLATGFELLDKNRIDVFVDYVYNIPDSSKLGYIQVMPERKIYLAFTKTLYGKQLSEVYDKGMKTLRDTKRLAEIFGEEYPHTKFAEFNDNKQKIIVQTTDVNLLRDYQGELYNSSESKLLQMIRDRLINYDLEFQLLPSYSQLAQYQQEDFICFSNMIKSPDRESQFLFSEPFTLYLGLRLYSLSPITEQNSVDLLTYLLSNPDKTIGIQPSKKYTKVIDQQLQQIKSAQKLNLPLQTYKAIEMFAGQRYDLMLEYPSVMINHLALLANKQVYSYHVSNSDYYALGHFMCPDTQANRLFINNFNELLVEIYHDKAFFDILAATIDKKEYAGFVSFFNRIFLHSNH